MRAPGFDMDAPVTHAVRRPIVSLPPILPATALWWGLRAFAAG